MISPSPSCWPGQSASGRVIKNVRESKQWDSPEALELIGKALRKNL